MYLDTFRQRVALDLRDLDGEGPLEGLARGDGGQHDRGVAGEAHVHVHCACVLSSAANRLISEVVQSRRRPLLGPSPG